MPRSRIDAPILSTKQIQAFFSHVDKTPGFGPWGNCWKWTAGISPDGYGKFSANHDKKPRTLRAHKVSHFIKTGIWNAEDMLHSCDTPLCVNPDHLAPGSAQQNIHDALARGRWNVGEQHRDAILTEEDVRAIRALEGKKTRKEIGAEFHTCFQNVYAIHKRITWQRI